MFYVKELDKALRFGDVIRGFVTVTPTINNPDLEATGRDYKVDIIEHRFYAILSPCCSISDQIISVAPLIHIRKSFYDNPFFSQDFTRINNMMTPTQSVNETVWSKLSAEEQEKRLREGNAYALKELFIYENAQGLAQYEVDTRNGKFITNYYMIDFRDAFKINCSKIVNPKNSPYQIKFLQLSTETRSQLRDKISAYYARIPEEDKVLLD